MLLIETTRFVELLFSVLKSEAYLPLAPRPSDIASLPPYGPQIASLLDSDSKVLVSPTQNRKSAEDFSGQDSVNPNCNDAELCMQSLCCSVL